MEKRPKSWYVPFGWHVGQRPIIYCFQRRVKFPTEFDAMDLATDELKAKLLPVNRRLLELQKERAERRKIRSRTKVAASSSHATASANKDVEMTDANTATASTSTPEVKAPDELEDEHVYRERELAELEALVHPDMKQDAGCSVSGLYELVGRCRCHTTRARLIVF